MSAAAPKVTEVEELMYSVSYCHTEPRNIQTRNTTIFSSVSGPLDRMTFSLTSFIDIDQRRAIAN